MKKYTTLEQRHAIVQHYREHRLTERQIASAVGVAPSTAHYWISRYDYSYDPPENEVSQQDRNVETVRPQPPQVSDETVIAEIEVPPPPPPSESRRRARRPSSSLSSADAFPRSVFENKPKPGRPRKLDAETDDTIYALSTERPFAAATDIRNQLGLAERVCIQTVRNRLRERGLRSRVPSRKDHLTDEHARAREAFAAARLEWTAEQWNDVLFTDEKIFCIGGNGSARVWRPVLRKKERSLHPQYVTNTRNTEWGRETIPVWGCISGGGRNRNHLHLIDPVPDPITKKKTLRSKYYVERILEPIVKNRVLRIPSADAAAGSPFDLDERVVFMHDNSRIHTANLTRDWLVRNRIDTLFDWPAKAPDMNPIENVWGELERKLRNRNCRDKHELWLIVSQAFEDLTQDPEDPTLPSEYVKSLVRSMPRRVKTVFEREGGWSEY